MSFIRLKQALLYLADNNRSSTVSLTNERLREIANGLNKKVALTKSPFQPPEGERLC